MWPSTKITEQHEWIAKKNNRCCSLSLISPSLRISFTNSPYILGCFGRINYSGHKASFMLYLLYLNIYLILPHDPCHIHSYAECPIIIIRNKRKTHISLATVDVTQPIFIQLMQTNGCVILMEEFRYSSLWITFITTSRHKYTYLFVHFLTCVYDAPYHSKKVSNLF